MVGWVWFFRVVVILKPSFSIVCCAQEVSKRKDAQKEAEAFKAEVEKLRMQYASANRMLGEMQAANAELRKQLRATSHGGASGGGAPADGAAHRDAAGGSVAAQLSNLEMMLAQRDSEVRMLRQAVSEKDQQLEAVSRAGETDHNVPQVCLLFGAHIFAIHTRSH